MFKILIIDPNKPFRRSLKNFLMNNLAAVVIDVADDGSEGSSKIKTVHPDLIFIEIHLPDESGLALARSLKTEYSDIIIAILTSDDFPEYQSAVLDSGIDYFIAKDKWNGNDILNLLKSIIPI